MDWSNINTNRDTSGLGPIEYDQTKVPALIRKHADNVRGKSYGQQVREAQARNAEVSGLIATEAVDISNETKARQNTVETQFNSVQREMTDKDVISAPEIIAARGGKDTLGARLDNTMLHPESFGAVGDGDESESIQNAFNEISGNTLKFDKTKTYSFSKKIIIENKKNFTVDFNGATLLDLGTPLPVVEGGNTLNPVGIKFVNCENFYVKGLVSDTAISVSSNTRIDHGNASLKSATVEFERCLNFDIERPIFKGSQGSNPISGYPYYMSLSEALNFGHIKIFQSKNVGLIDFELKSSDTTNEVIQIGETDGVRIINSAIDDEANNVSWGKFIRCTNVTFEKTSYSSNKPTSFIDVSGDEIKFNDLNLNYPNGKLLDATNEWGEIGGPIKNVTLENIKAIVDVGIFVSKMAMDWAPEGSVEHISPVDSIRVNDSVFGDKTEDGNTGGSFINNANRIIEIEVTNSKIYNMGRIISGSIIRPEEFFKNTRRKFTNCEFVNNSISGYIRPLNSTGKNTFDNCYFYNRRTGDMLSIGDEHAAYEGSIEKSDTKYIFNNCTFENINLKMEANIIFNNCTFTNCNFKNDTMQNTVQEFKNCELKWNSEHLVFAGYASQSLFQLMESKKVVFTNCTFTGNPKYDSGLMFDVVYQRRNHTYEFYNCIFDLDRFGASGNNIVVSLERPANINVTSDYLFSDCKFRGKTIPARIVGGSRINEATRRLTLVNCYSDQIAYEQSLYAINIGDGQALSSFELILLNNTFSNSENILSINRDFFGKIIEKNNTGVSL
ncbi:hypothetical protein ACFW0C_08960 [Aerococcus sp. NPDC058936]|uniref:hypothetical protein n=1 Tax=Aerococcus sp. NPDC058936 TaxID=3346674 RepID=UPI00366BB90E